VTEPNATEQLPPAQQILVDMTIAMGALANNIQLLMQQQAKIFEQQEKIRMALKRCAAQMEESMDINDSIETKLATLDATAGYLFDKKKGFSLTVTDFVQCYARAAADIEEQADKEEDGDEKEEDD
jgi:hypothetical protein